MALPLVQPTNTLRRCKKADCPLQIQYALSSRYPRAVESLMTIHTELKKDPGVPRLPNLKVRSAEKQRRRSVCLTCRPQLSFINTRISVSPSGTRA